MWISTVRGVYLVFLIGAVCIQCNAQEQRTISPNEQRVIELSARKRANRERLGDQVQLKSCGYFYVDELLRENYSNLSVTVLVNDTRLYELFSEQSLCKEMQLSRNLANTLGKQAKQLKTSWPKIVRHNGLTGDVKKVAEFELDIVRFEKQIAKQLTRHQLDCLKTIQLRNVLLNEGVPQFLNREAKAFGLAKDGVKKINSELRQLALSICRDANQQFISEIEKLLPGYLEEFGDEELAFLPLLPLGVFLSIVESPEPVYRSGSAAVDRYDINLENGDWIFSGPRFRRKPSGEVGVEVFSNANTMPRMPLMALQQHIGLSFSPDQRLAFQRILLDLKNKKAADFQDLRGRDKEKEIFEARKQAFDSIKNECLPVQVRPALNYVRLHSLFTLGPEFIYDNVKSPDFPSKPMFDKELKKSTKKISDLIEQGRSTIAKEIVRLVNKHSQLDSIHLEHDTISMPNSSIYESLFRPVLALEGYRIGK